MLAFLHKLFPWRRYIQRRAFILIGLALCLFVVVPAYIEFWLARPVGSGPAGPSVPHEVVSKPWSNRPILMLGVGDSITAGLGAKNPSHSYFNRLQKNPVDEFDDLQDICLERVLPRLSTLNLAISGSTSLTHIEVLRDRLPTQPSDVQGLVVMTTGGNDLIHHYGRSKPKEGAMYGATLAEARPWIANFEVRLYAMLDLISERIPGGCQIFLANIYDPTDGIGDGPSVGLPHWEDGLAIHAQYNRIISKCAEQRENVHLVDLHGAFLGHGSHCRQFWRRTYQRHDPTFWFFDNIEDPNDRGYDAIRRVFLRAMISQGSSFR